MTRSFYVDPDEELQLLAEEQEAQARIPIEGIPEQALDPATEDKAGPAFVEQQEEQIDRASLPIWHPDFDSGIAGYEKPFSGLDGFNKMMKPVSQGMVDTGIGFVNLVTRGNFGTGDLQDQWHRLNPQGQNVVSDLTRKLSGLVLPSLGGSSKLIGAANSLHWAAKLRSRQQQDGGGGTGTPETKFDINRNVINPAFESGKNRDKWVPQVDIATAKDKFSARYWSCKAW